MGQAHNREFFAQTDSEVALAATSLADGSQETGEEFNVVDYSAAEVLVILSFTTASGAAGDQYNIEVVVEHDDDDAFPSAEDFKSYDHDIVVDDNDGDHEAVVALPVKLLKSKEFMRPKITFTADSGNTGSASNQQAAAVTKLGGIVDQAPVDEYDRDGYEKVDLNV